MTDLVTGMKIEISEPVFHGSFKNPKFLGNREFIAEIIKESYGGLRGQHTFTLKVHSAEGMEAKNILRKKTIRRKGRNLYKNLVRIISQPENVEELQNEKHKRGKIAHKNKIQNWINEGKIK